MGPGRTGWDDGMRFQVPKKAALICLTCRLAGDGEDIRPLSRKAVYGMIPAEGASDGGREATLRVPEKMRARVDLLLSRAAEAENLIGRYEERGYRLILPSDALWPLGLRRLRTSAPLFLFVYGSTELLRGRCVAVAGSRDIGAEAVSFAERIGRLIADHKFVLVCGNARGTDSICRDACLQRGGSAILFPAGNALALLRDKDIVRAAEDGRVLLASEDLPDTPFSAAKALSRNHMIYAMGRPAVVVAARPWAGGSWHGAADCLKGGWAPVVAITGESADFDGCRSMVSLGARALGMDTSDETVWERLRDTAEEYERTLVLQPSF